MLEKEGIEEEKEKRKKTGGRKKGTPNKVTGEVRRLLTDKVTDYFTSELFLQDFAAVEPRDRLQVMERYCKYVLPALQATTLNVGKETTKTIEDRLVKLSMPYNKDKKD